MYDIVFAYTLAVPILAVMIALTALLPSWRWVAAVFAGAAAVLLWFRMSYGLFAQPAFARAWGALLIHSAVIAAIPYAAVLIWYLARRCEVEAAGNETKPSDGGG